MATFESAIERECRGVRANVVVQVASIARSETGKILRAEMANKLRAYLDLANDGDTSRE